MVSKKNPGRRRITQEDISYAPIPDELKQAIIPILNEQWVEKIIPKARDTLRLSYEIEGVYVTLYQERSGIKDKPGWHRSFVARIKYFDQAKVWFTQYSDIDGKWQDYNKLQPTKKFNKIIEEINEDPYWVF